MVADALSRSPVGVPKDLHVAPVFAIQPLRYSSAEMAKLQKQDKFLSGAFKNIEQMVTSNEIPLFYIKESYTA